MERDGLAFRNAFTRAATIVTLRNNYLVASLISRTLTMLYSATFRALLLSDAEHKRSRCLQLYVAAASSSLTLLTSQQISLLCGTLALFALYGTT